MGILTHNIEAIESRLASCSSPRGTPSRILTLRLRRCFGSSHKSPSAAAANVRLPQDEFYGKSALPQAATDGVASESSSKHYTIAQHLSTLKELRRKHRHTTYFRDPYSLRTHKELDGFEALGDGVSEVEAMDGIALQDGVAELDASLRARNPHRVLEALNQLSKQPGLYAQSEGILSRLSPSVFSELLRCLDPKHFVDRYVNIYQEISPSYANVLGLPPMTEGGHYEFCTTFLRHVQDIVLTRSHSAPLTLSDYKYLMRCARETGNATAFNEIWAAMEATSIGQVNGIVLPRITPDLECYNHSLAIRCWSDLKNPRYRYRLRVIPNNFEPRSWKRPPYRLDGHRTGPLGVKTQVSEVFQEMVSKGIQGNEETFCLMMTALARENDLQGVKSILQRVWEIDVDALLLTDETKLPHPKLYPANSPFYPSTMLLFTLAHAFGINNSIPTALHVIDYISRQYNVYIPKDVWRELLHWTYVLSIKRYSARKMDGTTSGQLPQAAVSNLWATMTSEPYNLTPDMPMYNRLIPNLLQRQRFGEAQLRMAEAKRVHLADVRRLSQLTRAFDTTSVRVRRSIKEQQARDITFAHLRVRINRQYIRRWVRLLISQGSRSTQSKSDIQPEKDFTKHNIPKIVEEWSLFLPPSLAYKTESGTVRFWTGSRNLNLERQRRLLAKNLEAIESMRLST